MNSYEVLPTDENLIIALEEDLFRRNVELVHFYNLLLAQEGANAIAIDGRWGSGKTFFVKQSMLVINAKNPICEMAEEKRTKITYKLPFKKDEENENYDLAIYYDAWENDNDTDPVMSIMYEITKQLSLSYPFKPDAKIFKTVGSILETVSGRNVNNIMDNLNCDNPLVKFREQKELNDKIKSFFSEILVERGNRLVVFIDELDRCKPSFAVHLLEQIKHYLCDDRITFVISVNLEELQHTIKHYYGGSFDACRYLDRFFDLRISLPPADKSRFYDEIGLNGSYPSEKVTKRFIENYNLELREITRYYRQVRAAVYEPIHESRNWDFTFPDGQAKQFMLGFIVPIVIGLRIIDVSLHDEFVTGKNGMPLIEILDTEEFNEWIVRRLLNEDESFENEEGKKQVTVEEKVIQLYNAIFVKEYSGRNYCENIGNYEFDANSKNFVISAASMLTNYASLEI